MPSSRIPSPARSQGVRSTPRKEMRRTRSVGSPARTNIRLSSIIQSFRVSPIPHRQSVLNDDTDIEMPRRLSWWKKINDNSRDVLELLERKEIVEVNHVVEDFDVEVLSQENKNYALDLPDSSDGESINSIVIPQKKLFYQKENQPQQKFGQIKNNRETLQKLNISYVDHDKELNVGRKTLFSQPSKPRTKPVFPAALLDISANKTVNKTKEIAAAEVKGQVRSLFGGRPGIKRKNMFADFIVSESEDEISEIQPKVFGFQKRNEPKRRVSSMSRHSPTSSIDLEMEEWRFLPSSTMVENQVNEAVSPVKRIKLSNLLETKESEISTNSNNTLNKTKQKNKSVSSKNKSKNLSNVHHEDEKSDGIHMTPRNATTNNSRVTRSMIRSFREDSVTVSNISKKGNKTKNQTRSNQDISIELKTSKTMKNISQKDSDRVQEKQNKLIDHHDPDDDFPLEYNNEVVLEIDTALNNNNKNSKDETSNNLNVNVVEDKHNLVKESNGKISNENVIEQRISTNKICENQEGLVENKQNSIESKKVSNYSKIQNNSQEIINVVGLNNDNTTVHKVNKSFDNNKNKSRNSVEKYNEHSKSKDMRKEKSAKDQSEDIEKNERLSKSKQNLNEENHEDQEMESEDEQNENDNYYEQLSDKEEEANESTKEENDYGDIEEEINEDEQLKNVSQTENVSEEEADNEEEVLNESKTDERDKKNVLDNQSDNIEDINQVTLPNISHDTAGRHSKKNKSLEVILHDKTKHIDSFTVQPRNTSVRKTKSIIFHNKLDTVTDFRKSTRFSDATGNSSAEGSGWDSHRTTRKTLRQTFGKDFTPRKSLRALVMEKTAKLQANFTEGVDNVKIPQANSTEYDQVQDELDSYQKTEVQLEQNIEIDQEVDVRDVTERFNNSNKTVHTEERDKIEQIEGRREVDQSKNKGADVTEPLKEREAMEQNESFERNETEPFDEREEVEGSEESEEDEQSEVREEVEESEKREEEEEYEIREEVEESATREEESEVREEFEESEEIGKVGDSEEREDLEQSEERREMEQSEEREEMEQSEERDEMDDSKEREELEDSGEREELEDSEEKREMEQSEEREEMEESEQREESEKSENEDRDDTEQFEVREEIEQSEDETQQLEEKNDTVPEDEIMAESSDHEVSKRTKQTSLEIYLQKFQQDNAEKRRKMQEELRKSLKIPKRDAFNLFKVPQRPVQRSIKIQKPKAKKIKSVIPLEMLPSEVIEDMKYKPPKRFQPNNASWITKRLYKFLENKLEPEYDYKARIRAEKLVQCIYNFTKEVRRHDSVRSEGIEELKREMARLNIVKTHFDFYEFCHEFFPREIRIKVVPDIVNNIQLPRHGVFSDILR